MITVKCTCGHEFDIKENREESNTAYCWLDFFKEDRAIKLAGYARVVCHECGKAYEAKILNTKFYSLEAAIVYLSAYTELKIVNTDLNLDRYNNLRDVAQARSEANAALNQLSIQNKNEIDSMYTQQTDIVNALKEKYNVDLRKYKDEIEALRHRSKLQSERFVKEVQEKTNYVILAAVLFVLLVISIYQNLK